MTKNFKRLSLTSFALVLTVFSFNAAQARYISDKQEAYIADKPLTAAKSRYISDKQEVYIADKPLPKIIKELREKNPSFSNERIKNHLKRTLTKVTPAIAREKFNINWKDNTFSEKFLANYIQSWESVYKVEYEFPNQNFYPALVICHMGPKFGYALFTLDSINYDQIIAEYTGKLTNHASRGNFYLFNIGILESSWVDAQDTGNAARFALGSFSRDSGWITYFCRSILLKNSFLCKEWLSYDFGNEINNKFENIFTKHGDNIVTPNTIGLPTYALIFVPGRSDDKIVFKTNRYIKEFEQICIGYGANYWKNWHEITKKIPCLFLKNGDAVCPTEEALDTDASLEDEEFEFYLDPDDFNEAL